MTSLQASLPDTASGLWRMDREYGPEEARVKHVVIHEAHLREVPDRHVVYRVDVFTQERNWCVYRRYSEFLKLHETLSDRFRMLRGSFPPKQISGNLSPAVIDERRSALEHYLLRIVNCHNREVASCPSVLKFLDLYSNDVYHVTSGLCRFIKSFGEAVIYEGHSFVLSPTQLFCIAKRLRIPNLESDYKADNVFCDLSSLYDFLSRLKSVTVKPSSTQDNGVRCELSLMKSLKELNIVTYSVSLLKGLSTVQLQLERLTACHAVTAMKDILIDSVLERKTQPRPPAPSEAENSWRSNFNSKAFNNAFTIHPWISLTYLDLSHNTIRQLDDSFSLLPNLQELNLSYNNIEVLDIGFLNPALAKLICKHSNTIKIICKTHENLAELTLDHNMITELSGFNKLAHLKYLNLSSNALASLDVVACLTELPRLNDIVLKDNPLSKKSKYRKQVLSLFAQMASRDDIMVDGKPFSNKEKSKALSTRVKSSVPHVPVDLPFFSGSTADQLPPAFMARKDDMWNTILHDTDPTQDISAESSPPLSEVEEEVGIEGALLSPLSSISARSTPRVYDWDPAEAFAKSLPKERGPSSVTEDYVICKSPHGSSDCLDEDHASSCCESGSCKEERSHSMKDFNNIYYSITGNDLYSTERPRINPFGQPSQSSKVINFAELDIKSCGSDSLTSVSPGEVKRGFMMATSEEDFSSLLSKESEESADNAASGGRGAANHDANIASVGATNQDANTASGGATNEDVNTASGGKGATNQDVNIASVGATNEDVNTANEGKGATNEDVNTASGGKGSTNEDTSTASAASNEQVLKSEEFTLSKPDFFDQLMTGTLPPPSVSEEDKSDEAEVEKSEDVTEVMTEVGEPFDELVMRADVEEDVERDASDVVLQDDVVDTENVIVRFDQLDQHTPPEDPTLNAGPLTSSTPFNNQSDPYASDSPTPGTLGHSSQSPIYAEGSSSDELVSPLLTRAESPKGALESAFTSGISISDMYDDNCVSDESDELDFTNSKIKIQF